MRISLQQYAQAWYTALHNAPKKDWDQISMSVIRTVHHQGKMKWLREIVRAVGRMEGERTGLTPVTVRLARKQDTKVTDALVQTILKTAANVQIEVDPTLIGGAQVETENSRWDLTVRGNLRRLAKTING